MVDEPESRLGTSHTTGPSVTRHHDGVTSSAEAQRFPVVGSSRGPPRRRMDTKLTPSGRAAVPRHAEARALSNAPGGILTVPTGCSVRCDRSTGAIDAVPTTTHGVTPTLRMMMLPKALPAPSPPARKSKRRSPARQAPSVVFVGVGGMESSGVALGVTAGFGGRPQAENSTETRIAVASALRLPIRSQNPANVGITTLGAQLPRLATHDATFARNATARIRRLQRRVSPFATMRP
jgi:hypothetical protein